MTDRGVIAFGRASSWKGVYNHRDSQPTSLGPRVHEMWQEGRLTLDFFKEHPGGFLSFPDLCFCHGDQAEMCGSCAKDSPFYIKGLPRMYFTNLSADPLMINWVYVLDGSWVHVLGNYDTGRIRLKRGLAEMYRTLVYEFREISTVFLAGPEPDWSSIEREHRLFMEKV
jgi:hypothetical protein